MKKHIILFLLIIYFAMAFAQNENMPLENDITVDWVQNKLKKIEETKFLEDEKKKLLDIYNQVLQQLKLKNGLEQRESEFLNLVSTVQERETTIKEKISTLEQNFKLSLTEKMELADLEKRLLQESGELDASRKELAATQNEAKYRSDRRLEIPKLLAEIKKRSDSLANINIDTNELAPLTVANNVLVIVTKKMLAQETSSHEKEILSYDARNSLIALRQEFAIKKIDIQQKNIRLLQSEISARQKIEADKAVKKAQEALQNAIKTHPIMEKLIKENSYFAEESQKILEKIEKVTVEYAEMDKQLSKIQDDFNGTKEKEKAAELTNLMGILLRQKLATLPDIHQNIRNISNRQYELPATQLKILEWDDKRIELLNLDKKKEELVKKLPVQDINFLEYLSVLTETLTNRKDYLEKLIKNYNTYFAKLIDIDTKEHLYVNKVKEFRSYIEERIFWVKSANVLAGQDFVESVDGFSWLTNTSNWKEVFSFLFSDSQEHFWLYIFYFLFVAGILYIRWRMYRNLDDITKLISRRRTDSFNYTIQVCFFTLVLACVVPIIMWFLGWRLQNSFSPFISNAAVALSNSASVYFILNLSYAMCMINGLGEAHFQWNKEVTAFLRKSLRWFIVFSVPIYFSLFMLDENGEWRDSLGRILFIFGMIVWFCFFYALLNHNRDKSDVEVKSSTRNLYRLGYFLSFSVPGAFIAASISGYHYTAIRLSQKIVYSITILIIVFFVGCLLLRWLQLVLNKLEYLQLKKINQINTGNKTTPIAKEVGAISTQENNQEASSDSTNKGKSVTEKNETSPPQIAEKTKNESKTEDSTSQNQTPKKMVFHSPKINKVKFSVPEYNIKEMMEQGRYSIRILQWITILFCMWNIWRDTLPAWKVLNHIELWGYATIDGRVAVTITDLIYFFLILIISFTLSKNLPALIEVYILQRFKLEKGITFAISNLTRYVFVTIGIIFAFPMLGFSWSQVQWLVAAFTVGLGFGLQEIFANFVSGLIILFERPIRVGDTVTIGDTSGTVSQIKIRATTITDWDRKELIVPNKEFITNKLVNWSLSDTILRLVINVGIAYGSDTKKAQETLYKVAEQTSGVLKIPQPQVVFNKFDSSSLSFSLRVFIPNIDIYVKTIHALHMGIDTAFREADIVIAFPQQDIHIRSICKNFDSEILAPQQNTEREQ